MAVCRALLGRKWCLLGVLCTSGGHCEGALGPCPKTAKSPGPSKWLVAACLHSPWRAPQGRIRSLGACITGLQHGQQVKILPNLAQFDSLTACNLHPPTWMLLAPSCPSVLLRVSAVVPRLSPSSLTLQEVLKGQYSDGFSAVQAAVLDGTQVRPSSSHSNTHGCDFITLRPARPPKAAVRAKADLLPLSCSVRGGHR